MVTTLPPIRAFGTRTQRRSITITSLRLASRPSVQTFGRARHGRPPFRLVGTVGRGTEGYHEREGAFCKSASGSSCWARPVVRHGWGDEEHHISFAPIRRDWLKGESLEFRDERRGTAYSGRIIRRTHVLSGDERGELSDVAEDRGVLWPHHGGRLHIGETDEPGATKVAKIAQGGQPGGVATLGRGFGHLGPAGAAGEGVAGRAVAIDVDGSSVRKQWGRRTRGRPGRRCSHAAGGRRGPRLCQSHRPGPTGGAGGLPGRRGLLDD